MKNAKIFLLSLALIGSFFFVNPVFAQSEGDRILEFKSNIKVNSDATTNIVEEITFDPSGYKHGIEWEVPYVYSVKLFRRNTPLVIDEVYYYPTSNPSLKTYNMYTRSDESGWAKLRIGDPDKYIQGTYTYVIKYTLKYSGISYFEENDEVYLNIIGPGWSMPIEKASANILLPGKVLESICFTGSMDSDSQDCTIENISDQNIVVRPNTTLQPYEGYTFAVKLEKGILEDTTKDQIWLAIISNIGIVLPIPLGIFLFGFLKKKYENEKITVIPNYEPEKDMDSLLSGILLENKYNTKHITALMIELAIGGYIKIVEVKKNRYEIENLEKDASTLSSSAQLFLKKLFEKENTVKLKEFTSFFSISQMAYLDGQVSLKNKDLLSKENLSLRNKYVLFGVILVFGILFGMSFVIQYALLGWGLGIFFSGILFFIFASTIDHRSVDGNKKYYYLEGLKMYINTAEKHRIEFHNDPEKYKGIFEKLLPYAIIFGLEKKWAKEFEDIYTQEPTWYDGNFNTFNAIYLADSLNRLNSPSSYNTPSPSYGSGGGYSSGGWSSGGSGFGGGGSSGGGGGGSGGGSW